MHNFDNVYIQPKYSTVNSRADVNLYRSFPFGSFIPIVASNMDTVGTLSTARILTTYGLMTCMHKYHESWDNFPLGAFPSIGISNDNIELKDVEVICIDTPNGYIDKMLRFCDKVRKKLPYAFIIAGNVICHKGAKKLADCGVDCVKVGIGQGGFCSTRNMTGISRPQLEAVMDCKNACKYIMSDGGIKEPGDVCKALVAGADLVMCGSVFAAHYENGIEKDGLYEVYGMASQRALDKHNLDNPYRTAEGVCKLIESKGSLHDTIKMYLGGLRSCCTYTNSKNIEDLKKAELCKWR